MKWVQWQCLPGYTLAVNLNLPPQKAETKQILPQISDLLGSGTQTRPGDSGIKQSETDIGTEIPSTSRFSWMFSSVQLLSRVWLFVTPWTAACQDSLSITNSWSLLKLVSIESMMPSNHLILPRERIFDFWVTWSTLSPTTQKIRFSWKSLFSFSLFGEITEKSKKKSKFA